MSALVGSGNVHDDGIMVNLRNQNFCIDSNLLFYKTMPSHIFLNREDFIQLDFKKL